MQVTYQWEKFDARNIVRVYIGRTVGGVLKQYDVDKDNYTIRESIVSADDYDPKLVALADARRGFAFNQVRVR